MADSKGLVFPKGVSLVVSEHECNLNPDINSAQEFKDNLAPLLQNGVLVGMIDTCGDGRTDRVGNVKDYNISVIIPSTTKRTDKYFGGELVEHTLQKYWLFGLPKQLEVGTIIGIVANDLVVIRKRDDRGIHERANVMKSLAFKSDLMSGEGDNMRLMDGYEVAITNDFANNKVLPTIVEIQENKFNVLNRVNTQSLDI